MTLKELGKGMYKIKYQNETWKCSYVGDHHAASCYNEEINREISIDEDKEVEVIK